MAIATKLKSKKPHQKARKTADCIQEKKKRSCTSTATQRESSESEDDAESVYIAVKHTARQWVKGESSVLHVGIEPMTTVQV